MRKFIEDFYRSQPSALKPADYEKMSVFVGRFMESDEYYLLQKITESQYRNKMQECNRTGSKTPEADLFRLAGAQLLLDQIEALARLGLIKKAEAAALRKAKKEEKKFNSDSGGYDHALGAETEDNLIG